MSSASLEGGTGADTHNFTAGSVSLVGTTIKGGGRSDNISLTEQMMLSSTLLRATRCSVELVQTPCFSPLPASNSIQAGSGSDSIVMSGSGMGTNTIDLGVGTDTIKFTTVVNADTVTVTSTTITGAKSPTYEKAATAPAITTGAGADVVVFEGAVTDLCGFHQFEMTRFSS